MSLLFRRFVAPSVKKEAVVALKSGTIYDHLSLEATLSERCVIQPGWSLLMVYLSNPHCVVIGRHQNPWLECNLPNLNRDYVQIARRISGGGTVYHDDGNVNFSIISDRSDYNRHKNLEILASALKSCDIDGTSITDKFDVLLGTRKISGTAARLDKWTSLHHFTCLVDANLSQMENYLTPTLPPSQVVSSRATASRPAPVANVSSAGDHRGPLVSADRLIDAFVKSFFKLPPAHPNVNNYDHPIIQKTICSADDVLCNDAGLISDFKRRCEEYRSWDWIFGKTPPFVISCSFSLGATTATAVFSIEEGCVDNVEIQSVAATQEITLCQDMLAEHLKDHPLRKQEVQATMDELKPMLKSQLQKVIFKKVFSFLLHISP